MIWLILALVVVVFTAAGLAVYTVVLRSERSELTVEADYWAAEYAVLEDTVVDHEDTIAEQGDVIQVRNQQIADLTAACDRSTALMNDATAQLEEARRALIIVTGTSAGMSISDIQEAAGPVE